MSPTTIRQIAYRVRALAEDFARSKGYDARSLVTMCSTVSAGLVVALASAGIEASMVAGVFKSCASAHGWGHFWVEAITVTNRGNVELWLVDLTATQFACPVERCRPRRVVFTRNESGYASHYVLQERREMYARMLVMPCDIDDVAEFEAICEEAFPMPEAKAA